MTVLLAPDVYVNASVALGSPPDQVVQRVLGDKRQRSAVTPWILERVRAMLSAIPEFREDAVEKQISLIKGLVEVEEDRSAFAADDWTDALISAAQKVRANRVITDHPDLLDREGGDVEFISTEAWLVEQAMPPPPPV